MAGRVTREREREGAALVCDERGWDGTRTMESTDRERGEAGSVAGEGK